MVDTPVLSNAFRNNLQAIQRTQTLVDKTTLRLATGQKVNSALDNPQNYFDAIGLNNRAHDLSQRLDGIGNSIRTINESIHGVEAIESLLNVGESIVTKSLEELRAQGDGEEVQPAVAPLSTQILDSSPIAYWRLNETAGNTAVNLGSLGGSVDGTYQNAPILGDTALYDDGETSVDFNGANQSVSIPDHAQINLSSQTERTIEMVFNADSTAGRQVLFEEGATVNALTIYILDGDLYVTGRDSGAWGPANISMPINAGEIYHVAFTINSTNGEFIGYVNGNEIGRTAVNATFPAHSGDIAIGAMRQATWFHDGSQSGNGLNFDGKISDVAIYNDTLSAAQMSDHAASVLGTSENSNENQQFNNTLDQITLLSNDASYRGINLIGSDNLVTFFDEKGSSTLLTKGVDFTSNGLNIKRTGFDSESELEEILEDLRAAIKDVRDYGRTLSLDLSIVSIRDDFTDNTINTLLSGAQDLTQADANTEGANLLAAQVRQQMAVTSLAIASSTNSNILNLFA